MKRITFLLPALLLAFGMGCGDSSTRPPAPATPTTPTAPAPAPAVEQDGTVNFVHWLGRKQLAADTNAAFLMEIWNQPESATLERQTLDKVALVPWRLQDRHAQANAASALLRPLVDDLVQEECYLEIRPGTNQPGEVVFAIRLDDTRAGLWKTNLAAVLETLTGARPVAASDNPDGWSLQKHDSPQVIALARAGDWTLVGARDETNSLMADVQARVRRDRVPFRARTSNYWLEVNLDLPRVAPFWKTASGLSSNFPAIFVRVAGDRRGTRTTGELRFQQPLPTLEPWNMPTNLIHDPVTGFTALRGIPSWLASLIPLPIGRLPDQIFLWGLETVPMQTFFAAPSPDAEDQVNRIAELLTTAGNAWLATNGIGSFRRLAQGAGVNWGGILYMSPFLRSVETDNRDYIYGGLFTSGPTNRPLPVELLQQVFGRTNLVGYDWEITEMRARAWVTIGRLLSLVLRKPVLQGDTASMQWFKVAAPRLGNCITVVVKSGPQELSLVRNSGVGFTGIELCLLANWVESPQFPFGLYPLTSTNAAALPPANNPAGQPASGP